MSLEKAKKHLEKFGLSDRIRIAKESTATVALAAKAFDCEEKKIAKTLSFMLPSGPILVLAVGDARIDNAKFKHTFAAKAKMTSRRNVNKSSDMRPEAYVLSESMKM